MIVRMRHTASLLGVGAAASEVRWAADLGAVHGDDVVGTLDDGCHP